MGTNAKGLLQYLTKKAHSVLTSNHLFPEADIVYLMSEIKQIQALNTRVKKPVMHFVLAFPEGEKLDEKLMRTITEDFMHQFGADKNQWISIQHFDTEHKHNHVLLNRVKIDGNLLSDSFSHRKAMRISRALEIKYGLKVLSSIKAENTNESIALLKRNIDFDIIISKSIEDFISLIEKKSYDVKIGRGIVFIDKSNGAKTKGSAIGREYSLKHITERIEASIKTKDGQTNTKLHLSKELREEQEEISDVLEFEQDIQDTNTVQELFDVMVGNQYVGETPIGKKKKKKKEERITKRK